MLKVIRPVERLDELEDGAPSAGSAASVSLLDERLAMSADAGDARHGRPGATDRGLAALVYVGAISLIAYAVLPRRQFIARHVRLAMTLHLLRFFWLAATLLGWWALADPPASDYGLVRFGADLGMLLLAGTPWLGSYHLAVLPWILTPVAVTWLLSLGGLVLGASAKSADFYAFTHADWNESSVRRRFLWRSPEEEKRQALMARERHMQRLQYAHRALTGERQRQDRMGELREEIERLQAERSHNEKLLAVGEISRKRYDALNAQIDEALGALRDQLAELSSRVVMTSNAMPERLRVSRLERGGVESRVNTIAIVTPSGVPLFSYGHFQLDEALVAGILSAFDSVSEEVFGSRVHKTELAEGQVLYFAHGQHVIVLAIFVEEPSPRQLEQLRTMLQQFEVANASPLARKAFDPTYLHEVQIPFKFSERLPRGE